LAIVIYPLNFMFNPLQIRLDSSETAFSHLHFNSQNLVPSINFVITLRDLLKANADFPFKLKISFD